MTLELWADDEADVDEKDLLGRDHVDVLPPVILRLGLDMDDDDEPWSELDEVPRRFMISKNVGRIAGSTCQQSAISWA
jgi:hypothetical protein